MNQSEISLLQKFLRSKNCPTGSEGVIDAATISGYQDYLVIYCGETTQRSRHIIPQSLNDLSAEAQAFIAAGKTPVVKKEVKVEAPKMEAKKESFLEKGKEAVKKALK